MKKKVSVTLKQINLHKFILSIQTLLTAKHCLCRSFFSATTLSYSRFNLFNLIICLDYN